MNYMAKRALRTINQHSMKEENIKQLFSLISSRPDITRAKLVRITSLSPTTVSTLVDELIEMNLVEETGQAVTNRAGRKPISLQINPKGRQIALFSLNRWGVRFSLNDLSNKQMETRFADYPADRYGGFSEDTTFPDPDAGEDYAALIESILHESLLLNPNKLLALCISFPGIYLESEQVFSWSAMHVSISCESIAKLETRLGVPVFLGNSSMSRAYAELKYLDKPGRLLQDLIYVNVCDGLGAGILVGGEFLTGSENSAGEIGHVSVNYQGKRCACGRRGCVEQYVNLDALIRRVKDALITHRASVFPDALTLEAIGQAYDGGDHEIIREQIDDIAAMLFTAIYSTVCITGIKRVVIGGGIERLGPGFLRKLLSFTQQNPYNTLMRNLSISYALSGMEGDCEGIAQFYLDNIFRITAGRETAPEDDIYGKFAATH